MQGDGVIAICATFTAEPVKESLQYWLKHFQLPAGIEFAAYNQVIQTLIDPGGLFARNRNGLNVVLLRPEDYSGQLSDVIGALKTGISLTSSPILVCICPPTRAGLGDFEREIEDAVSRLPSIRFLSSARLGALYPVADPYDAAAERLGHIPYTPEAYAALGTAIVRVYHASRRAPYKVIAVDCDNTLWRGVCGEGEVEFDPAARAVQSFLKQRQSEGMLLCACSKNTSEDVERVFDRHPEMTLQRTDFAGWRVNWRPKSENIRSLAAELRLALDSFIFLDDNPMETAEVEAGCPGVVALTLPVNLDQVWAFDQPQTTAEDRKRTVMVRENALRESALAGSLSYADFLRGLELHVEIRELNGEAEIGRAAQMTERTNQFNFTTRRFTAPEIRQALAGRSMEMLAAFVRDRFGDYGQVGLVMYEAAGGVLHVQNFLLSCRALGKGVEHRMVARLGELALSRSLSTVEFDYQPTSRNKPAGDFLASLGALRLSSAEAAAIRFSAPSPVPRQVAAEPVPASRAPVDYQWIATYRASAAAVLDAIHSGPTLPTPDDELGRVTRIWERALRKSPIGVHDNFFDLGGDSLIAVRVLADLKTKLPLSSLVEAPTIARLADLLRGAPPRWRCLVPIKTSGNRLPFYCVHGVGGNVLEYLDLARQVHPEQPFYGIQAIGLSDPGKWFTIEEMAERYLREIREFQPEGPYCLGGSSLGGLVAYEMARQLTGANQPVGLVALFDTSVPGAVRSMSGWRTFQYRLSLHWHNLAALNPRERVKYLAKRARRLRDPDRLPETIRSVQQAGEWAATTYLPGGYTGDVVLFRATEQPPWIEADRTLGWRNLVKGEICIYDTPGHHADLVRDPRAKVLAEQLEDALVTSRVRTNVQ